MTDSPSRLDALDAELPALRSMSGEAASTKALRIQTEALLLIARSLERMADRFEIEPATVELATLFDPVAFADELDAKLDEFTPAPDAGELQAAELAAAYPELTPKAKKAKKKTLAENLDAKLDEERAKRAAFLDEDADDFEL